MGFTDVLKKRLINKLLAKVRGSVAQEVVEKEWPKALRRLEADIGTLTWDEKKLLRRAVLYFVDELLR